MRIINLNPDSNIGASAWFVEINGHRILMDTGVHPKREGREALPLYPLIEKEKLDAITISHCHHDHVGSLPVAMRQFPEAHVMFPELSRYLVERVLHNSVNVMIRQRDERGVREYPLYSHDEIDANAERFQAFKYNREVEWASFQKTRRGEPSPTLEFFDAGHAFGSAGILLRSKGQTVFYTGDVCFHDQTILKAARFENVRADVLIMETTRGGRAIPAGFSRESEVERFSAALPKALAGGGCVLVPTFALGRTQEILAQLALMMKAGKLRRQPIYIGGLGRAFTEIYDYKAHLANRHLPDMQLTEALQLIVMEKFQAEKMKLTGGKILVLTAGMMTEQTPAHDIAARMIGDPRQSIYFVGYADPDTPGGRLKASKPGETFVFSATAGEVTRSCQLEEFDLTAHANRDSLLDFVGVVSPRTVLLGHGEEASRQWFEEQIHLRYPGIKVIQPQPGLAVEV